VSFHWKDSEGNIHQGSGFVRDVSICGLFVATLRSPPIGATVRLEVCFDSQVTKSPIAIHAKGRVCRVEGVDLNPERRGFAATTKRLKFLFAKRWWAR
jgi:hypothetical protein